MTTLNDQQEKTFIKQVISKYASTAAIEQFDDCVVIDLEEVCHIENLPYLVYNVDHPSFVRRHLGEEIDHRFYGRWVAAIVCGDVLAMGAQPRGFSLDLAVPLDMRKEAIEWIYQGIKDVLDVYDVTLEGGNIDINRLEMVGLSWGIVARDRIIRRSGAKEGDHVVVTGILGFGWADWILRKLEKFNLLSSGAQQAFRQYKLMPLAPHKAILEAVETGGITSGMDLSDGPIEFFYTILERSDFGVCLDEERFPITTEMQEAAKILGVRPSLLALEAGYDTPLTHGWTVTPEVWPHIQKIFKRHGATIYSIGQVTDEKQVTLKTKDGLKEVEPFWDDQFRKENVIPRWFELVKDL